MASFLRSNLTFLSPYTSTTQPIHNCTSRSYAPIRCGPRDNRGPLVKGRVLSTEAIQAVQSVKRAHRGDQTKLNELLSKTLSRLMKADLIATFNELLRQDHCDLALKVFSVVRSEVWYKTDLTLYGDLVSALARKGMPEDIDRLIEDLDGEGVIPCDNKGLIRLIKALIAAERAESTVKIYGLMKRSGWGCTSEADEYVAKVLSRGLKRLGKDGIGAEIDKEIGTLSKAEHRKQSLQSPQLKSKEMQRETLASSSSSSSSSRTDVPPPEDAWVNSFQILLPRWKALALSHSYQSSIPISISRVNQIDAARLDIEMSAMLKEQLIKVFSLMKPGLLFQYEPELDAFLEFLIWRFSIWVDKPTPGNALMNLRYRDERAIVARGKVRTVWARLQSFSAFRRWGDSEQRSLPRRAWSLIQRIEGFYKAASFTNLLIFLYTGRYRNLIERAVQARLIYGSPNMNRAVSFEYMNRQLVWNEFSEMLLLLLPLLNSSSIRNILHPFSKDKSASSAGDETVCPICQASPTIPFLALPCQHRYCYYCLRTRCSAASSFRCSRCSEPVIAMQRHSDSINIVTQKQ
ncbi:hypothetical protein F0562_024691 [Nyssa sinensis]|uniref:RING-type E3 ubiquitin transferase (cysteine targeting) n=1 Tax=Nyssa sinensis TaxID=561372 RepID=A0A5J5BDH6_9ASTE|nr:hypothetical protein F0562_024691 [Nyssa sinensis]